MPEVDPRFDPQYQRGYDPAKHRIRPASRFAPQPEQRAEARPPDIPLEQPDAPVVPTDLEPPRRNPYRWILLIGSIVAIAGAGVLLWRRIDEDPYNGYGGYGGDTGRIFLDQFSDALLAPLLTGGLLGLCLWIALGALRRRDDA